MVRVASVDSTAIVPGLAAYLRVAPPRVFPSIVYKPFEVEAVAHVAFVFVEMKAFREPLALPDFKEELEGLFDVWRIVCHGYSVEHFVQRRQLAPDRPRT